MTTESTAIVSPQDAIRFIAKDADWSVKSGLGGLLYAVMIVVFLFNSLCFPISICLFALLQGYSVLLINQSTQDPDSVLPNWKNWGELLIAGLTWMTFSAIRMAVEFGIAGGILLVAIALAPDTFTSSAFFTWAVSMWTFLIIFWTITSFYSTYLFASFAAAQESKAAFAFSEVTRRLLRHPREMITGWLLSLGIFAIAVGLPLVTVIGAFLVPSTAFFAQILTARLLAQVWRSTSIEKAPASGSLPS